MFYHLVKNSRHFGIGINKPHHRGAGHVEFAADVGDGFAFPHEGQDFILFGEENLNLRALTRTPSELDAGGFSDGESLLGPHGDQAAFDVGGETEGEAKYLTINGIVERVAFFYGVEFHAGFQAMPHYFHDFDQCPAQSGDFRDDDGVAFFFFFFQFA